MGDTCEVCGQREHHALCPVPRIAADPNRALTPEVAMSDWADLLLEATGPSVAPTRERTTEILGLVLNWGIRPLARRISGLERAASEIAELTSKVEMLESIIG